MTEPAAVKRALISVSDKTGISAFGRRLQALGIEILSTGGSAKALQAAGVAVTDVSEVTGFPEIMDGRVKTLHPKVHGGILARRDEPGHVAAMEEHGIQGIDLVAVNLYPFRKALDSGAGREACIENIDIGGPALIRAAAKNHAFVTVVTDPADYAAVAEELEARDGATSAELRRRLAAAAYAHTAAYDSVIAGWLAEAEGLGFPKQITIAGELAEVLRYGENPHQEAAFYLADGKPLGARAGVAGARQRQGKALSYNNLNDTDAAYELAAEFDEPAVAIIKHANPCGVAVGATLSAAYEKALASDPVSAYGGIVAVNRTLDEATAARIAELFVEVVIAPRVAEGAARALEGKNNLRLLEAGDLPDPGAPGQVFKSLAGGLLVQGRDNGRTAPPDLRVVTKRAPTAEELADLIFAFRVAKHVKSNAIVYAKDGATVGIGAGQMSRVDSSRIAAQKSWDAVRASGGTRAGTEGSVVASDAFFPFADGLLAAAEAGAQAVIQPGGSLRDDEVIDAANRAGLAMVLTGQRHFRH